MSSLSSRPILVFLLLLTTLPALTQTPPPPETPPPDLPYTLHLHQDLIQIPVLVLDQSRRPRSGLKPSDFAIQLDSGPIFHPRSTHIQADDPLSVILLLDAATPAQRAFLDAVQKHLATLPATLFRPQDRLSVFAFDCNFIASARGRPASSALLQHAVTNALADPALHAQPHQPCPTPLSLWDAVTGATALSNATPGRRVLFIFSPGKDGSGKKHSTHTWEAARRYAATQGFTLLGIRDVEGVLGTTEDPFSLLCGGTGGTDVYVTSLKIDESLRYLFDIIRKRYIIEFPLAANGTAGLHHIEVTLADRSLTVRTGGDSTPLLDPSTLNDPTITPDAPTRPTFGTRKPLDPKP